jgi:membrane-bound serine protease (ClpP class)
LAALLVLVVLQIFSLPASAPGQPAARPDRAALLLTVEGGIGPGIAEYVRDGLDHAAARGAALVVLRLDTPGGLDTATRVIVQAILASPVPVAVWVAPRGARAASAGLFLLSAAQLAVMAPGTATGAATPVSLGGGEDDAMRAKTVNDAAAYVRGLAEYHGRNPDWLEQAVREAASLPAAEALQLGVIDFVAEDLPALLSGAEGRRVRLPAGPATLETDGLALVRFDPDWQHRLLAFLSDPNIAFLLLMIGAYGLVLEFAAPGIGIGGVVGGIALVLGLFAVNLLPVDVTGLVLMALGVALLVAEAFIPAFGVLGLGGLAALALGGAIAFDFEVPGFRLSPWVIGWSAALGGMLLLATIRAVWRTRGRPVLTGGQGMIGARGRVLSWSGSAGVVLVHGERWAAAAADGALTPGQQVRVLSRRGLRLEVTAEADREGVQAS